MARQRSNVPFSSETKSSSPLPPSSVGVPNAFATQSSLRIVARDAAEKSHGSCSRVFFSPSATSGEEIELSHAITSAIAYELWRSRGGSPETNWADAQTALEHLVNNLASKRPANGLSQATPEIKPESRTPSTRY
jgi:hypothetical protein